MKFAKRKVVSLAFGFALFLCAFGVSGCLFSDGNKAAPVRPTDGGEKIPFYLKTDSVKVTRVPSSTGAINELVVVKAGAGSVVYDGSTPDKVSVRLVSASKSAASDSERSGILNGESIVLITPSAEGSFEAVYLRAPSDDVLVALVELPGQPAGGSSFSLENRFLTVLPEDGNQDSKVSMSDLSVAARQMGKTVTPYTMGDIDGDGVVTEADYKLLEDYLDTNSPGYENEADGKRLIIKVRAVASTSMTELSETLMNNSVLISKITDRDIYGSIDSDDLGLVKGLPGVAAVFVITAAPSQ